MESGPFDVAISFAGEDRRHAKALADILIQYGLTVFYDEYRQAELWGKNLNLYLADVYAKRSKCVVILLSRHYAQKVWPVHELKSALSNAIRQSAEYILPVRLDDTTIPGINPDIAYLRCPPLNVGEIAENVLAKLGRSERAWTENRVHPVDGAEIVLIPRGEFLMGSEHPSELYVNVARVRDGGIVAIDLPEDVAFSKGNDEMPRRRVYLDEYWIYRFPVTVEQYQKFCTLTGHAMPKKPLWGWIARHPIVNVTWEDADAYCRWAGCSLPTGAQWEKAARGADGREYPWGNDWDPLKCANGVSDWGMGTTSPVGSYLAGTSPYGVFDMAGSVDEWCTGWYDPYYYRTMPDKNPPGASAGEYRVFRGGSIGSFNPSQFRCAGRHGDHPRHYLGFIVNGFRPVFRSG
jgi:formylglycine-generating enzyme required for sulfatase activity